MQSQILNQTARSILHEILDIAMHGTARAPSCHTHAAVDALKIEAQACSFEAAEYPLLDGRDVGATDLVRSPRAQARRQLEAAPTNDGHTFFHSSDTARPTWAFLFSVKEEVGDVRSGLWAA